MPYYSEKRPARTVKTPARSVTAKQATAGKKPGAASQSRLERVLEKIRRGRKVKQKVGTP